MLRNVAVAFSVALIVDAAAFAKKPDRPAPVAVAPTGAETCPRETKAVEHLATPLDCDRLTIADGLPNSNVRAIVQDRLGFIWFGTQDGLARYDGSKMRVYRSSDQDPAQPTGFITALLLDPTGKLLVGTAENGVNVYDADTDSFVRIAHGNTGLSSDGVSAMARDSKDRIWFAMSGGGIDRYDAGKITAVSTKGLDVAVTAIDADRAGNVWLGTASDGVIRWNPDTNALLNVTPEQGRQSVPITAIRAASTGKVWIGTDGDGLYELDPAMGKLVRHAHDPNDPRSVSDDHISVLLEDARHTLWIGTANGLDHIDETGRLVQYQHDAEDPDNPTNLAFPAVESLYQDAGGVIWAGGFTVGVCKFDEYRQHFGHYRMRTYAKSFFEDPDGSLWVGTLAGLYKYEWATEHVVAYHTLGQRVGPGEGTFTLDANWVLAVHRDRHGTLWLSVGGNGLIAFDPKANSFRQYLPDSGNPNSLPVDTVYDIWEDKDGVLWLASWGGGLVRFDPAHEAFTAFTSDGGALTSNHLYSLYPDPTDAHVLWVGTAKGGLVRFDTAAKSGTSFRHRNDDPASLSSDDIVAVYKDPAGILWVGTYGGGLDRLDTASGKAQRFTTGNSKLTNDTVYGILGDATGKLWLSTNGGGLLQLDPKTSTFVVYDASNGIQDNEFSQGAFLRSKSGKLFFGGAGGFNAFSPGDIARDPQVPPVVLTGFTVLNHDVKLPRPIWTLPAVEVSYADSFEVQFAALAFAVPKKNRYAYQLEGFDDKFIETDHPAATYTKLGGGTYTLRVKAANRDGVWNDTGVALKLTVSPPFWRTRRAFAVYMLALALLGYLLYRWQQLRVQRAEREGRLAVVERDLELAGAVQSGFLPENQAIRTQRLSVVSLYRPADNSSGDWWWHEALPGSRHVIMVGDVSGHGPGPAMVTAAVATAFRVLIENGLDDVSRALELLNREVLRVGKARYNMTMAALELNEKTGRWTLYSAGAPPMLSIARNTPYKVYFSAGAPLGTEVGFETGVVQGQLEHNERLLIYTDGIPETPMPNGKVMGMRRLAREFESSLAKELQEAAASLATYAEQVRGDQPQADDWTFTMVEWS